MFRLWTFDIQYDVLISDDRLVRVMSNLIYALYNNSNVSPRQKSLFRNIQNREKYEHINQYYAYFPCSHFRKL